MTRTRHAIPGRLLRSALTVVALAGVVAGVALLHGATSASAYDGLSAELMQSPLVVLPDTTSINQAPSAPPTTVGELPLSLTQPLSPLSTVFVTQVDPGASGAALTPPASISASDVSTLLAALNAMEGTEMLGLPSSITVVDIVSSDLGG